jgi:hypothetical protein
MNLGETAKISRKEGENMTKSKHEKERQWNVRKQDQHPHGKVESFKELEGEGLAKGKK